MNATPTRKKLIEVALPLDAINKASAREKSIRHGHPSTLHLWWARRPLAAARAVIFAQMVDDPSEYADVLLSDPNKKRAAIRALKQRRAALLETANGSAASGSGNGDTAASGSSGPLTDSASEPAMDPKTGEPSDQQALRDMAAELERDRLFAIIEELVVWENTTNEAVLERARAEIWQSWRRACAANADHPRAGEIFDRHRLPAFHDPFAGGGALPLEAQRLGLEAHASDLNPVAVLINKAMIEIPPRFAGCPPVNPAARGSEALVAREWSGARGLAEDVRYYGRWMREEAHKRIGHLYPKVEVTPEMVRERPDLKAYEGRELTVIAWLWARTVKSPNPAFAEVDVPLASTFMLSTKKGKEAYVEPVIEGRSYHFAVKVGTPPDPGAVKLGTKSGGSGSQFLCLMSGSPMPFDYLRSEAKAGRMGTRLLGVVAEGDRSRVYLAPTAIQSRIANEAQPNWSPDTDLPTRALGFRVQEYGMRQWRDLFTRRQLVALTTFSDLVGEAMERACRDHMAARSPGQHQAVDPAGPDGGRYWTGGARAPEQHETGDLVRPGPPPFEHLPLRDGDETTAPPDFQPQKGEQTQRKPEAPGATDNEKPLRDGGTGARAYAEAVGVYLAFALDKGANYWSSICAWDQTRDGIFSTFGRQALPMVWDFAEANPFSNSSGNFVLGIDQAAKMVSCLVTERSGWAMQADAAAQQFSINKIVSTDPPYYDNIGYADLSDFFYVWLRKSQRPILPDLFGTLAVPKADELVATPYRHGGKRKAETFFLEGMSRAIRGLANLSHPAFPITIYYAFKQSETKGSVGTAGTGWDTFLNAVIRSGFAVTGTLPIRTELTGNLKKNTASLASSIVLVCRRRPDDAPTATRREYLDALRSELPQALRLLRTGNIAPVDLAQAAIGPGMAVYTRYAKVLVMWCSWPKQGGNRLGIARGTGARTRRSTGSPRVAADPARAVKSPQFRDGGPAASRRAGRCQRGGG